MEMKAESGQLYPSNDLPRYSTRTSARLLNKSRFQLYKDIVHVKVGENAQDFGIHKGLLCNASSYFKKAFTSNFKEARESLVRLCEDDVDTFQRFQLWLYTGNILDTGESLETLGQKPLIELYVWAEFRGIPNLQDFVIDLLQTSLASTFQSDGEPLDPVLIEIVYSGTLRGSPLRILWARYYRLLGRDPFTSSIVENETIGDLPQDFLLDVISSQKESARRASQEKVVSRGYIFQQSCRLHVHGEGVQCTKKPS